jgi:hypothetical protein
MHAQSTAGKPLAGTPFEELRADLYEALTGDWQNTQDVARAAGYEWAPARSINVKARQALYWLHVYVPGVEHEPQQNGHRWRRADA